MEETNSRVDAYIHRLWTSLSAYSPDWEINLNNKKKWDGTWRSIHWKVAEDGDLLVIDKFGRLQRRIKNYKIPDAWICLPRRWREGSGSSPANLNRSWKDSKRFHWKIPNWPAMPSWVNTPQIFCGVNRNSLIPLQHPFRSWNLSFLPPRV